MSHGTKQEKLETQEENQPEVNHSTFKIQHSTLSSDREQLNLFTPPKSKLNTLNPDQITYQHGHLQLAVLGGVSLQNLDRLRVTLKINLKEREHIALRQNLDLYHDDAVQKLVRRAAEKLETGPAT